jgi:hypothetical protein
MAIRTRNVWVQRQKEWMESSSPADRAWGAATQVSAELKGVHVARLLVELPGRAIRKYLELKLLGRADSESVQRHTLN